MQKWAEMLVETGKAFVDPSAMMTQMREDSDFRRLPPLTILYWRTLGHHKASRRWTWHSPDGQHHNQIDNILARKCFRSGVKSARTRSFPGADIGSDHDLPMMIFYLRLKRISKPIHTRHKFDLEKMKESNVLETFQVMIGRLVSKLVLLAQSPTEDYIRAGL